MSNDGLENGTFSCALTSDDNDLREGIVIDLTRNVLELSETCSQNVEGLAHDDTRIGSTEQVVLWCLISTFIG